MESQEKGARPREAPRPGDVTCRKQTSPAPAHSLASNRHPRHSSPGSASCDRSTVALHPSIANSKRWRNRQWVPHRPDSMVREEGIGASRGRAQCHEANTGCGVPPRVDSSAAERALTVPATPTRCNKRVKALYTTRIRQRPHRPEPKPPGQRPHPGRRRRESWHHQRR